MRGGDGVTLEITGCENCKRFWLKGEDFCHDCGHEFEESVEVTA